MIARLIIVAVGLAVLFVADRVIHRRSWRSRIDRLKQRARLNGGGKNGRRT